MDKKHDLLAKLRSMGMIIPEPKLKANLENRPKLMTEKYQGFWKESQTGKVFIFDKSFQYDHYVGDIQIKNNSYANLFNFLQQSADRMPKQNRIAFIDIETSNLGFGSGSIVFLIGICYFKTECVFTRLLFIDSPANEAALINEFDNLINSFDVICSYNGKSFDVPFLKNRAIFHKIPFLNLPNNHLDLLHISRQIWKYRLESRRLSDVESEILGFVRNSTETPGWLIPQIYYDFLDTKNPELLAGVFYHNRMDVLSLAALLQKIDQVLSEKEKTPNRNASETMAISVAYLKKGQFKKAAQLFSTLDFNEIEKDHLGFLYRQYGIALKHLGNFDEAVRYFLKAVNNKDLPSCIELAKIFEHTQKNFKEALKYTELAISIAYDSLNGLIQDRKIQSLLHRKDRILRKAAINEK